MKGFRFYEEFGSKQNKRKGISEGNVIALCLDEDYQIRERYNERGEIELYSSQGAFVSVFSRPDSPVNYCSVAHDYLSECCKRVSEKRAREIHPELFRRLDHDAKE